jgi:hypothetical protein
MKTHLTCAHEKFRIKKKYFKKKPSFSLYITEQEIMDSILNHHQKMATTIMIKLLMIVLFVEIPWAWC